MSRRYDLSVDVQEQWGRYLREQSLENFITLRQAVVTSPAYDPASEGISEADALLEDGKVQEAKEKLRAMMPGWLLSPRAHKMISYVFYKLGHLRSSALELRLGMAVRQGILWTGDGTAIHPYLVLRGTDVQDILTYLKKIPDGYACMETKGQSSEVWNCRDGSRIWFANTMPNLNL